LSVGVFVAQYSFDQHVAKNRTVSILETVGPEGGTNFREKANSRPQFLIDLFEPFCGLFELFHLFLRPSSGKMI